MADTLCRTNPDSAVSYIQSLSKKYAASRDDYNRNYYQLLRVKAANNAYKPLKDSTIFHVMDFYEHAGDKEKLCQAYYYVGKHFVQENDAPQALQYFQKSLDLTDEETPVSFLSCIYSQTGRLFLYQSMFDDALLQYEKSFECDSLAHDTVSMLYSMRDIATIYDFKKDYHGCLSVLKKAYEMSKNASDNGLTNTLTQSLAICYQDLNDYKKSKYFLFETLKNIDKDVKSAAYSLAIDIYSRENKYDSVVYYSHELMKIGTVYSKQKAAATLCKYYSDLGDSKSALRNLKIATSLTDSINSINALNTVAKMHFAYNYNQKEKEKLTIENIARQEKYFYAISLLVLSFIIALAIYFIERNKKRFLKTKILYEHTAKQQEEAMAKHKMEIKNFSTKTKRKE